MRISDCSSDVCASDLGTQGPHWWGPRGMSKGVEVDERVLMRSALDDATHDLEFGRPLPAYLRAALLKFQKTQVKQRTTALLLPKLVERHARAGAPKSNATAAETAFEKAAVDVGVSPKTAQRAHRRFPPERDED